ncbi:MAG: MarR family EPS-associated transcriptional regulator [Novosphingobium sp.]
MGNHLTRQQREDMRFRVLRLLANEPDLSQREMATKLGVSLGRANYCLNALIEMGFVKVENFKASRHKLGYIHVLTPKGIAERTALATRFLKRKLAEYDALSAEIKALKSEVRFASRPTPAPTRR